MKRKDVLKHIDKLIASSKIFEDLTDYTQFEEGIQVGLRFAQQLLESEDAR